MFTSCLALMAAAYYARRAPPVLLFWAGHILTRPPCATLGDMLAKPHASGGLALGRITSSAALPAFMVGCILVLPQAPARVE